ncbi:MAG: SPOR domain-containing protein [Parabacteroides sp.]|nr:SPOR domain-containing protein [Parabacteroides sp.]
MLRIVSHIEQLLWVHDCVIIPGIGGFVFEYRAAGIGEQSGLFVPPRKEALFNPTLCHNDGLLAESYMKTYGLEYAQALEKIEDDIRVLKETLAAQGSISLGTTGCLRMGEEGNIVFEHSDTLPFDLASYGLGEFRMPTLALLMQEQQARPAKKEAGRKKDTIYIPVSVRFLRTVVASAAAVALFLLVSTPVKDVDTGAYTASFIPSEVVLTKEAPAVESVPVAATTTTVLPETTTDESMAPAPVVAAESVSAPVAKKVKYYHVVIGSFPNRLKADQFFGRMDKSRYREAGIVERNGKARVYAARFTGRNEAETYMNRLRNGEYKDAWLFISR